MKIAAIGIRNFRSLNRVDLEECSASNLIIGKNNSGKSNVLSAISLVSSHIKTGELTSPWKTTGKPADEIFGRSQEATIQIGLQYTIDAATRNSLLEIITAELEGSEYAVERVQEVVSLTIILNGSFVDGKLSQYVHDISFGELVASETKLSSTGHKIYHVPEVLAHEVVLAGRELAKFNSDLVSLERANRDTTSRNIWRDGAREEVRYFLRRITDDMSRDLSRKLQTIVEESSSAADFSAGVAKLKTELQSKIDEVQSRNLSQSVVAFSGNVRRAPDYVIPVLQKLGEFEFLHFRENRKPVGLEEAEKLLRLKTTRGGPGQLTSLQAAVKSLLGVSVDAFEAEGPRFVDPSSPRASQRTAEMDIDEFLVEANGAGIREALRIVLDLELLKPQIALIEEPEVHLHPGLEKSLHNYLNSKIGNTQIFIASHSTNFIDVAAEQNVYIIKRSASNGSTIERAISDDELMIIPGELGLKPSSVLMFDKLIFVEGPTDEAVLSIFAAKLGIDLPSRSVGFIRMGGSSNMAYFAADATLDLLSRRQIPMALVIDRDEKNTRELDKIRARLGERAIFHSLKKRELENYLLEPEAVFSLIKDKRKTGSHTTQEPASTEEVAKRLNDSALGLKDQVIVRRIAREALGPIYIDRMEGSNESEKLEAAKVELNSRISSLEKIKEQIGAEVSA